MKLKLALLVTAVLAAGVGASVALAGRRSRHEGHGDKATAKCQRRSTSTARSPRGARPSRLEPLTGGEAVPTGCDQAPTAPVVARAAGRRQANAEACQTGTGTAATLDAPQYRDRGQGVERRRPRRRRPPRRRPDDDHHVRAGKTPAPHARPGGAGPVAAWRTRGAGATLCRSGPALAAGFRLR